MNTIEKGFDDYANKVSKKNDVDIKKFTDRTRNELYRAMNWTIDYAKKNGYEIVNFVQDDFQFLYENNGHLDDVIDIFNKNKNIVQVNCNLMWRRKIDRIGKLKNLSSHGRNYTVLLDKHPCDNGYTRVNVYNKTGAYPEKAISWGHGKDRYVGKMNGELWFGKQCGRLKLKRAVGYMANAGMVFDCAYVRGDERYGEYFPPPGKFYFHILGDKHIAKIKKRHDKKEFSFIEDYCIPDGWKPKTMGKHSESKKVEKI